MKKSTKVHLFFGSDCGMMKFFTLKPQPIGQLMCFAHLCNTVWRKRSRLEHAEAFLHGAAQNFELLPNIQDQK
jgi:hypothetical protein